MAQLKSNRLASSTSPYLLQHAENPVDWFPWGAEAFRHARDRDVPIFLSVGYAACHWCHVMERESFEDSETAALLNERFVAIKVDREERPDVDAIYMDAVQAMTGSGGWPMSVFLTPDLRPFYAGTYFPDRQRHGLPSFREVLEGIAEAWQTRRDDVEAQGGSVTDAITRATRLPSARDSIDDRLADAALATLASHFDSAWGGFGPAPKFPQPMVLEWLLRQSVRGETGALEMATGTLDRMAAGGIHDQVGGGFARYSIDNRWHVPHFEKMLSDNAQMLQRYTEAWLVTRQDRYRDVASRTAGYLIRELRQPDGGFASSQDADSEGVEGRYYVWSHEDVVGLVGDAVADALGALPEGNWEGTNVLWLPRPIPEVAAHHGLDPDVLAAEVVSARAILLDARDVRKKPATDDKVIAAWNGLTIRALAIAGRAFGEPSLVEAANEAATFVWGAMGGADGLLRRSWRSGVATVPAFLDDHALLGLGLLTLYETTGKQEWFTRAAALADAIFDRFQDPDGGFFLTPSDADPLIVRPTDVMDTATPSATSATSELLVRLARYTGTWEFEDRARVAIEPIVAQARAHPTGFGHALNVADLLLGPMREIAIVGDPGAAATTSLTDEIFAERYLPNAVTAIGQGDGTTVPLLAGREPVDGEPTAYLCERFACRLPTSDAAVLAEQLTA